MAKTIRTFVGDGVTTRYPISFDLGYARQEFVYVYQGELTDYENQLGYVWVSSSEIELDTPVPTGQEFYIRRIVPRNIAFNNYVDGAILREDNLDSSFAQALMIWEELSDGFYDLTGESSFNFNLNMNGNTITGVTVDNNDSTSVINVQFADNTYVNINGDTMQAPLSGVDAQSPDDYMPQRQVVEVVDDRIESIPGFDPQQFTDYGLVTSAVGDELDYGSVA